MLLAFYGRNIAAAGIKMAGWAFARPAFYRLTAVRLAFFAPKAALPTVNNQIIYYLTSIIKQIRQ